MERQEAYPRLWWAEKWQRGEEVGREIDTTLTNA